MTTAAGSDRIFTLNNITPVLYSPNYFKHLFRKQINRNGLRMRHPTVQEGVILEFQLIQEAAQRFGVTVRAVQKWAKEGKIPGAKKSGRDWLIPINAHRPGAETGVDSDGVRIATESPLPFLNADFEAGKALDFINSIPNKEKKSIALGEYYYYLGDCTKSSEIMLPLLESKKLSWRISAALMCVFNDLSHNVNDHVSPAEMIMRSDLNESIHSNSSAEFLAMGYYLLSIIKVQMHLPLTRVKLLEDNIKYLPDGHKLFACYLLAYVAYMDKNFERALAIADIALAFNTAKYPLAEAYLHIISAIVYMEQKNVAKAEQRLDDAWQLLGPDGLIMPIVEHYTLLQGLAERYFRTKSTTYHDKLTNGVKNYKIGWYKYYNKNSGKNIAENLSNIEFTVAMLYYRNWRVKEIAEYLGISERTVKNHLQIIYAKLGINAKKELEKHLIK